MVFLALIIALIAGVAVQRLVFGTQTGWHVRLSPLVALGFLLGFDLVLISAVMIGSA